MRTAWDRLGSNFWRFFVCAVASYFPFLVLQMIVKALAGVFPALTWIVFDALRLALSFAGAAVAGALLSHLYRDIPSGAP